MSLTDKTCLNAKPRSRSFKLSDEKGLYLEVMPNGGKYWRFRYRFFQKDKRLALGVYPEVSLAAAREKRNAARQQLDEHVDPAALKREHKLKAALAAATTFESVAREWHARNKSTDHEKGKWSPQYAEEIIHRLEVDIFPEIGREGISTIRPLRLLKVMQNIEDRGARHVAHRVLQWISQIFKYAEITERVDRDVTPAVKSALKPLIRGHFAALEVNELPDLLRALDRNEARLFPLTRSAIALMMLTFVRTSELIKARWNEIDFETAQWTVPVSRIKMRRHAPWSHIVPLSTQAVAVFRELQQQTGRAQWIFPCRTSLKKYMSENTILKALDLLGYKCRMTGHGFRALAKSAIKEKLRYRDEIVELQLSHTSGDPYDRARYLEERGRMMQDWADYLDGLRTHSSINHRDQQNASEGALRPNSARVGARFH